MVLDKSAIRSQLRIASAKSLPPFWQRSERIVEVGEPRKSPEIKYKQQSADPFPIYGITGAAGETKPKPKPADPFPLYGGRLGWGNAARKRGFGGPEFKREPAPAIPASERAGDGQKPAVPQFRGNLKLP